MKRPLILALLLTACATASAASPSERVRGCWIDRNGALTTTMRWLPDRERPGVLSGDLLQYTSEFIVQGMAHTLEQREGGWSLCRLATGAAPTCWRVAEGLSGSLEGGRAFIDAHGEGLRISVMNGAEEDVIFEGRRDGCD